MKTKLWCWVAVACLSCAPAWAQLLESDFSDADDTAANWTIQGNSGDGLWAPVLVNEEDDTCFGPALLPEDPPCNLNDGAFTDPESYVLLTTAGADQGGAVWSNDTVLVKNLTVEAVIELRDGTADPADGGAVVLIGSEGVPGLGGRGGGQGMIGLGPVPTMAFEFDNWTGPGDPSAEHADIHYSAAGLDAGFNNLGSTAPGYTGDLVAAGLAWNNTQVFPDVDANRFLLTCMIQSAVEEDDSAPREAVIAYRLQNIDTGDDLGIVAQVTIPDFVPYMAHVGVTAATGGATQNSIVYSIVVTDEVPCLLPPASVSREISNRRNPDDSCGGDYFGGDVLPVVLTVDTLRPAGGECTAVTNLTIVENVPAGFSVGGITDGGVFSAGAGTITWDLSDVTAGDTVGYDLTTSDEDGSFTLVANITNADDAGGVPNSTSSIIRWGEPSENCAIEEFDVVFLDDPRDEGWILQGNAKWIPSFEDGPILCADPNVSTDIDGFDCTLYDEGVLDLLGEDAEDFGGYILATEGQNSQGGNAFRSEAALYDNFEMTVVVELRDGALARPADGMTIVVVGSQEPPPLGGGGGGMGATGLGEVPTMVFEFDNWSCNAGDQNDENHVGFAWAPTGIAGGDVVPADVFVPLNATITPLHNKQPAPADPNRYRMTVLKQGNVVACLLEAIDLGIDLGTVYSYVIDDFVPFRGYLGVTASTGGANQNHILHSAKLSQLAPVCIAPPGTASRSIEGLAAPSPLNCGGEFVEGDEVTVTITLDTLREGADEDDICQAPASVRLTDTVPAGWEIVQVNDGGSAADGVASWDIDASVGATVSYTARAGAPTRRANAFNGSMVELADGEVAVGAQSTSVGGKASVTADIGFDDACGGIICWNTLGPYQLRNLNGEFPGNNPGIEQIQGDHMTDGDFTEIDFPWAPGRTIDTAFGPADIPQDPFNPDEFSYSAGITTYDRDNDGEDDINVGGVPTVHPYNGTVSQINLNDDVYTGDPNEVMAYAQIYVINDTDDEIEAFMGVSSDDSVQVIFNEIEVHVNSVARGGAQACNSQDAPFDPVLIQPGVNSLIIKTFEGLGGFNFSFRFQNAFGLPLTAGLSLSKFDPDGPLAEICDDGEDNDGDGDVDCEDSDCDGNAICPVGDVFVRGDADASGSINLTDGVNILLWSFQGGPEPACLDAADTDNSGAINLSDPIRIFQWLFLGGAAPVDPEPAGGAYTVDDCGVDTGDDPFNCLSSGPVCGA